MIYLDHNATTPVSPEVLEAMMPYFTSEWGNPSSSYKFGSKLKSVMSSAREQVADLIGAHPFSFGRLIKIRDARELNSNQRLHVELFTQKCQAVAAHIENS